MQSSERRDLVPNSESVSLVEPGLTLEEAKVILQAVVSTHEVSILPQTPLDQVCGFSGEQIRQAVTVIANDLRTRCDT